MTKADALDRALVHELHIRLLNRPESISDAALRPIVRVALAYTQAHYGKPIERDVVEEFDEDSLALVEILALAVLQRTTLYGEQEDRQFG